MPFETRLYSYEPSDVSQAGPAALRGRKRKSDGSPRPRGAERARYCPSTRSRYTLVSGVRCCVESAVLAVLAVLAAALAVDGGWQSGEVPSSSGGEELLLAAL